MAPNAILNLLTTSVLLCMAIRVAINGFGRIGRAFVRVAHDHPEIEVVAANDLGDIENLAYLLKYDSAYGTAAFPVGTKKIDWRTVLTVDGKEIPVYCEKDPNKLPWGELGVDVVVEATGHFTKYELAKVHLDAGARHVVVSAPAKGDAAAAGVQGATVLLGINEDQMSGCTITSNGSCTTNAAAPVIEILHESVGVEKAMLNTIHAYTATQSVVDGPSKKDFRKGRAAAQNIIPTSTGAAVAVTKAVTDLSGKFDGIAMRVPVVTGSMADITFVSKRPTSAEEINGILRMAAEDDRWKRTFAVTEEPLVSSDIAGSTKASIADLALTRVVDGTLVKVCAWYDNEMGYTGSLVEHVLASGRFLQK